MALVCSVNDFGRILRFLLCTAVLMTLMTADAENSVGVEVFEGIAAAVDE